jgi:hypothetical protein
MQRVGAGTKGAKTSHVTTSRMTFGGSMLAVHVNKGARNPPKQRSCAAAGDIDPQRSAFDVWEEEKRAAEAEKAEQLREFRRQMRDAKVMRVRAYSHALFSHPCSTFSR